jgi:hypothetical protein
LLLPLAWPTSLYPSPDYWKARIKSELHPPYFFYYLLQSHPHIRSLWAYTRWFIDFLLLFFYCLPFLIGDVLLMYWSYHFDSSCRCSFETFYLYTAAANHQRCMAMRSSAFFITPSDL